MVSCGDRAFVLAVQAVARSLRRRRPGSAVGSADCLPLVVDDVLCGYWVTGDGSHPCNSWPDGPGYGVAARAATGMMNYLYRPVSERPSAARPAWWGILPAAPVPGAAAV